MKFKIKTNLVTGIVMALISGIFLYVMPTQIKLPKFDSGAPSPRLLPTIYLVVILIFSLVLIVESLVFKKEKIFEFNWETEKPAILIIALLCAYVALIITCGYIIASVIVFPIILFYCGERRPFIYIFTIACAVGIYYLFAYVFHISLPAGPFGG